MTHRETVTFKISSASIVKKIIILFVAIELILVALDLSFSYAGLVNNHAIAQLFNLAREGSLGSWFSSTQLLLTGMVLWLLFIRFLHDTDTPTSKKYSWALMALFFTLMAIDDAAAIHESIGSAYEDIVTEADAAEDIIGGTLLENYPSYSWQLILGPAFILMGFFILVFLWIEVSFTSMRLLLVAGLGCYALAVGLDYIEGLYGGYKTIIVATSLDYDSVRHLSKVIEEFLEMLGTTLFFALFVVHLARHTEHVKLSFLGANTR